MSIVTDALWRIVAFIVSRRMVAEWLVRRSLRTPYRDLDGYMTRNWLFNAYPSSTDGDDDARGKAKRFAWLPSIRVHHILREDRAEHPHDHPWDARTIILRGWYIERPEGELPRVRRTGDTGAIKFGAFHHIERVSDGGVLTLFFTWRYGGGWGFLKDGVKVPWREYVAMHPEREA